MCFENRSKNSVVFFLKVNVPNFVDSDTCLPSKSDLSPFDSYHSESKDKWRIVRKFKTQEGNDA